MKNSHRRPGMERDRSAGRVVGRCTAGCALVLASCLGAAAADFPPGLLLHYNFDDGGSGAYVADRAGKGHTGRGVGTSWTSGGRMNGAFEFASSNSCVQATNSPALNVKQGTFAAWIRTSTSAPAARHLFDKQPAGGFAIGLSGEKPDAKNAGRVFFAAGGAICHGDAAVTDSAWHHVAGVCDGTNLQLFVDGQLQKQTATCHGGIPPNDSNLVIGLNRSGASPLDKNRSFDGVIDEAMVFGRPLSATELTTVITATKPKFSKDQVARRLAELKDLYDRGLILQDFYDRKVKECEVNQ